MNALDQSTVSSRNPWGVLIVLLVLLIVSVIFGVSLGSTTTSPLTAMKVLLAHIPGLSSWFATPDVAVDAIIYKIRLPRVVLAVFVGAALAVAGASLQGLLRNPLAEPYTIGVASGAAVGAALVIIFAGGGLLGVVTLPIAAFLGALLTGILVYRLAVINGHLAVETLILAGVVMSSFMSAILSYLLTVAGQNLQQVIYWLMGSLGIRGSDYFIYTLPFLVGGIILLCFFGRDLNILTFGEEAAGQLGVPVERTKQFILLLATLLTGIAVSLAGTIGFVGLIVPHLVRLTLGPDHRVLLPVSAVGGGIFLIWADIVARVAVAPVELPVGVVTAFLGAPFFMYLLRTRKSRGYF
ncbi:MAG TPA: iron ABC transporter permease [Syntrophomonadaceae bacterium]|nr:iron ABC transporter permease [Syntrophomonadaceae bacterium]